MPDLLNVIACIGFIITSLWALNGAKSLSEAMVDRIIASQKPK